MTKSTRAVRCGASALVAGTAVCLSLVPALGALAQDDEAAALEEKVEPHPRQQHPTRNAGEGYLYSGQFIPLHRSLTEIAVAFDAGVPEAEYEAILRRELPDASFDDSGELRKRSMRVVKLGPLARTTAGSTPATPEGRRADARRRHEEALATLRFAAGARFADPVFVNPATGGRVVLTDEVVAKLKPGQSPEDLEELLQREGLTLVEAGRRAPRRLVLRIDDPRARNALEMAWMLNGAGLFEWVEPNFIQEVRKNFTPNDPLFGDQWHLHNTGQLGGAPDADVDAPAAWNLTTGSPSIVIAVIDDAVDLDHEDLSGNIFTNPGETPGNGVDDDGNGYVDDVHGWDFDDDDSDPRPETADDKHGTAVAGVAAARGNNGRGGAGACPSCRILPVRLPGGRVSVTIFADAIEYAGGLADVLSNSWGLPSPSNAVRSAIQSVTTTGRGGRGAPVLFASGNDATGLTQYTVTGLPAGTYRFRWEYLKNAAGSDGDDTAWLACVRFPGGAGVDFESGSLPAGFSSGGDASWTVGESAVHADQGSGRSWVARAGGITHSESTYLDAVRTGPAGNLRYSLWVSSEADRDVVRLRIDRYNNGSWDWTGAYASGVPQVTIPVAFPASVPESIAIGASSDQDYRSTYSQYGPALDVVAPSDSGPLNAAITTTDRTGAPGYDPGDYHDGFGGTSSATPLTAGVVGLMLSRNPDLTEAQVRDLLRATADKIGPDPYSGGRNDRYGFGRVNAYAAVRASTARDLDLQITSDEGGSGQVLVTPPGETCANTPGSPASCSYTYLDGTEVTLAATAAAGSTFVGWSGSCSGTGTCNITMTASRSVVAGFGGTQQTCTSFSISPSSASPGAGAGSQMVTITGVPAGCVGGSWTASGNGSWITVAPGSGAGSGSTSVYWAQNTGVARSDSATIAGHSFVVTQVGAGPICTSFSLDPTSLSTDYLSASQAVSVIGSPAGCAGGSWTATGNGSWITVNPAGGTGPGSTTVFVAENDSTSPRNGSALIAGNTFPVSQSGGLPRVDVELSSGVSYPDSITADTSQSAWNYYFILVPEGVHRLTVRLDGLSADADLYVRPGSRPDLVSFACRSYFPLEYPETCDLVTPEEGLWWIGVNNWATGTITYQVTARLQPAPHDFDCDGQSDILWHHQGTGHLYSWLLDGTVTADGSYLTPDRFADTRWQIRGIADFDGDGMNDVLWHHQTSGALYVWLMDELVAASGRYLTPSRFSDTRWQIRGIADFNGDAQKDILWHHQGTGHLYVWYLNGTVTIGGAYLTPDRFADTRWQIRGVADFDGDGDNDVLWHHQRTGDLYVWFLEGTVTTSGSYLTPSRFADTRWKIVEVADFDGDGGNDLLWHHQGTGHLYVWFLSGTVTTSGSYLTPARFSDVRWKVVPQ